MTTWLNFNELSTYLKLPKSTLYKMTGAGQVPGHKIGRSYRFDRDEVDKWIKTGGKHTSKRRRSGSAV